MVGSEEIKKIDILIIVIIICLSFINPLKAAMDQYYILMGVPDDIVWVYKASTHLSQPSEIFEKIGTGNRPLVNVFYTIGYWLWGSNETFYYLMNGVFFTGAMVFLYLLIKLLHSRLAGVIAVLFYLFLDASFILVSKMNFSVSIVEIFFITSSLYYSIHFFKNGSKKSMVLAFILGIAAFFSKEPSILIIPAVNILYILHMWKSIDVRTRVQALLVNISLPLLFLIFSFFISPEVYAPRQGLLSELIKSRLLFYLDQELSGQLKNPYILFMACAGTFFFYSFKKEEYYGISIDIIKDAVSILIILTGILLSLSGTLNSLTGDIIILLLLAVSFKFGNVNHRLGIIWFSAGLAPLLITSQSVQPTYLAEANLGMVLLISVIIADYLKYILTIKINEPKDRSGVNWIIRGATILMVMSILVLQLAAVPGQINNTNNYHKMVSDNQQTFKGAVEFIKATVPINGTIYYVPDQARKKVDVEQIGPEYFHWLLCLKGRCDIEIKSLDSLNPNSEKQNGRFVVLLSSADAYIFVNEYKSLAESDIFVSQKQIKNGNDVAYILQLKGM